MEIRGAVGAFGALAQETRLRIFRLLVKSGPQGVAAGEIARALRLPQNTLSFHLSVLARAGLVAARRDGRSIIYALDLEGTRALLGFLIEDCCRGKPELCEPLIGAARLERCS